MNESSSCSKISNPPASSIDSNESVAGSSTSQRDKDADLNSRRLGMDSDVEILSNPSQSSIEVLNRYVELNALHLFGTHIQYNTIFYFPLKLQQKLESQTFFGGASQLPFGVPLRQPNNRRSHGSGG